MMVNKRSPSERGLKMKKTSSSMTAKMSAFARAYYAEHAKEPAFEDAIAKKLFQNTEYQDMQNMLQDGAAFFGMASDAQATQRDCVWEIVKNQMAPMPVARARYCEDCLQTEIQTGTKQYVILGAGYDTFAWRHPEYLQKITVFEVDQAETQDEKKQRLLQAGLPLPSQLHFVPVDFRSGHLQQQLVQCGFDVTQKTFFSLLGVSYYLTETEIERLLTEISAFAAEGSTLVFDYADAHLFQTNSIRIQRMLALAEASGEPMQFCSNAMHLTKILEASHFLIYEMLSPEEMQERYLQNSELVSFSNIHYVTATIKGTAFLHTKEKILQVSLKQFSQRGFDAVSVREIAGELGLTQSALYKHYENKQAIFEALLKRAEAVLPKTMIAKMDTVENIQASIISWFSIWTENAFGTAFRQMINMERYHNPAAEQQYADYFLHQPLADCTLLMQKLGITAAEETANSFYAEIFFLLYSYDIASQKKIVLEQLQSYVSRFFTSKLQNREG